MAAIGLPFTPTAYPIEIMTLSQQAGVRLRATVIEFGPVLLSRNLNLNDAQEGIVSILFKYCDENSLPLLDLKDFQKVLHFATNEGKDEIQEAYGLISTASTGTILRKIIELEQQGGDKFFGERSFDVKDLTRLDEKGRGIINVLRVTDIQGKPKLFSTFMLQLLAEVYATFPERGDRAVAGACAANPVAVAIPCHRVMRVGGALAGYRWGIERKRSLLDREAKS